MTENNKTTASGSAESNLCEKPCSKGASGEASLVFATDTTAMNELIAMQCGQPTPAEPVLPPECEGILAAFDGKSVFD